MLKTLLFTRNTQKFTLGILFPLILFALIASILLTNSQNKYGPELIFTSYILESGTDGQVGATYRFSDVMENVDALVSITNNVNTTLMDLDITSTGNFNSFQPLVRINSQSSFGNTGFMSFHIQFVEANTNTPTQVEDWKATAVDVDGDNYRIREGIAFDIMDSYRIESFSELRVSNLIPGIMDFNASSIKNADGIDETATEHMITAEYTQKTGFLYRAIINVDPSRNGPSSARDRMFSLNFNPALIDNYVSEEVFPVEFASFDGRAGADKVLLNWSTASELNNDRFEVERSTDGREYMPIGNVKGHGTTEKSMQYEFVDYAPKNGQNYYRLKQIDFDGQAHYSEVLNLNVTGLTFKVNMYPNPVRDFLQVTTTGGKVVNQLALYNLSGQLMQAPLREVEQDHWEFNVSELPSGTYFVKLEVEDADLPAQKIVIP